MLPPVSAPCMRERSKNATAATAMMATTAMIMVAAEEPESEYEERELDENLAMEYLAESKGMEFSELLSEVEAIVFSGTKINIDYFIPEVIDEDSVEDIFLYFQEADSDSLEDAVEELGMYSEEEIRLIRIKFLSDMAN